MSSLYHPRSFSPSIILLTTRAFRYLSFMASEARIQQPRSYRRALRHMSHTVCGLGNNQLDEIDSEFTSICYLGMTPDLKANSHDGLYFFKVYMAKMALMDVSNPDEAEILENPPPMIQIYENYHRVWLSAFLSQYIQLLKSADRQCRTWGLLEWVENSIGVTRN
jgi:hypothetical protein